MSSLRFERQGRKANVAQAMQQGVTPLDFCGLPDNLAASGATRTNHGWQSRGRAQNTCLNKASGWLCIVSSSTFGSSVLLDGRFLLTALFRFMRTLARRRNNGGARPLRFGSGAHEPQGQAESYKPKAMDLIAE